MKKNFVSCLVIGLLILATIGAADAAIIASSDFDTGNDSWTWLTADWGISWQGSGGNPDGYMKFDNNKSYGFGATSSIYAPSKFLGNWSAMGATCLSYEANIFSTGSYIKQGAYNVYISGPGGEYIWRGPAPNPNEHWLLLDIPLIESYWTFISGNWNKTIENITKLQIGMAYYTNTGPSEITGIDNVKLSSNTNPVPEPASLFLFGSGIAVLIGSRIRRKKF